MLDLLPRDIIKYICIISQNHYVAPRLQRVSKAFSFLNHDEKIKILKNMIGKRMDYNYGSGMISFGISMYYNSPYILINFRIKINPFKHNHFNIRLLGDIITEVKVMTPIKREQIIKPCLTWMSIDDCNDCFEASDYGFFNSCIFEKDKVNCFDNCKELSDIIPPLFYNIHNNDMGETFLYLNCNEDKEVDILITAIVISDNNIRDKLIKEYCIWNPVNGLPKGSILKGYL